MIDIEKEREAFEAFFYENCLSQWEQDMSEMLFQELENGEYDYARVQSSWLSWQAAKAHEAEKLKGCVVVPVELSETVAEKLALGKVEKPRQENDVVWQEIADRTYRDRLLQNKWEIIRDYKELVEAVRGGK